MPGHYEDHGYTPPPYNPGGFGAVDSGTWNYQSPSYSPFYISPWQYSGDDQASRLNAAVARQQYEDYKRRFIPIRNMLINEVTTDYPEMLEDELDRTRGAIGSAYTGAQASAKRARERYGLSGSGVDYNQSATSAMVGGLNLTRQRSKERRMNLMYGGMAAGSQARYS